MRRTLNRLSAGKVKNARVGMHSDGGGLYLQVTPGPNDAIRRSWIYRYASNGRERHMGLGSLADIGLAAAREKAADARKLRLAGQDPIEAKKASKAALAKVAATAMTFDACCDAYIAAHRDGWRNAKHQYQWIATLRDYASPVIGKVSVSDVDTALVCKVLEPIWAKKQTTANRLRGRIERVLDWAKVRGYREGENPARWRGHLNHLLAPKSKLQEHHAALSYAELPAFLKALRKIDTASARALEFAILTAARSGEVLGATTAEISKDVWTVPANRTKRLREHRVPLCDRALALIPDSGKRLFLLSQVAMRLVLKRMGRADLTVHGFRSTFRDWAAERTNFPNEVVEMALAHAVSDKVEAAYRRGDLFDKRRRLMEAWAEFCEHGTVTADVVPLRA